MHTLPKPDMVSGMALSAVGFGAVALSMSDYSVGNLAQVGPGLFPILVGGVLGVFGVLIVLASVWQEAPRVKFAWRPLLTICAAMLLFGLSIDRFGIVPAVVVMVLVATLAGGKLSLFSRLMLAGSLSVFSLVVFNLVLGMPVPIIEWKL
ncbi:MAG TPA: tripartite tricarboxylate transporter TctB family protein [Rhizobium sp.]